MSKPVFVASVPRACSTAFERVFMTRKDILDCVHEPFGDAYYFGPERLGLRYNGDDPAKVKERIESGFSNTTYKDVVDSLLNGVPEGKRRFIKDITYYLVPPATSKEPTTIASSLESYTDLTSTDGLPTPSTTPPLFPNEEQKEIPNPTVLPLSLLKRFQITFLIRNPVHAIPSYYRCTVPPLSDLTGFHYFCPSEAGFRETRLLLEYLLATGTLKKEDVVLIDADDLLDNPSGIVSEFCKRVGIDYKDDMLTWESEACGAFDKWKGFHEDAMKSGGLKARTVACVPRTSVTLRIELANMNLAPQKKPVKSMEQNVAEWTEKYGAQGAELIKKTVEENMEDYEWMKQFKLNV